MQMIIEDVAVLENMIKQLIELKSMEISQKESVNMNEIITDALQVFEKETAEKNVQVTADLMDKLPHLFIDKKLMKRALCNMIKNALKQWNNRCKGIR
jgi:signal transduction histidine kinase